MLERRGDLVARYLTRLDEEARTLGALYDVQLDTVYLGGGTPSFLRDAELDALVGSVRRHLGWGRLENTLEVNPGTVTPARAEHWRALGFDRASVGVQSLDDATLRFLGRQHSAQVARDAVTQLRDAGFRVSGDLITAVTGQPLASDVAGLVALGVEHVSAYTLTIEPGTPFARQGVTVREEDEQEGFELTEALLTGAGFERYEISNYARSPSAQSRHNRAYWTGEYFLGLGPGGAGYYPPTNRDASPNLGRGGAAPDDQPPTNRDASPNLERGGAVPDDQPPTNRDASPNLEALEAVSGVGAGGLPFRRTNPHLHEWLAGGAGEVEVLRPEDVVTDAVFMALRLQEGMHVDLVSRRSGVDVRARYGAVLEEQVRLGLLEWAGERVRATPQGWWVLNRVVTAFLEADEVRGSDEDGVGEVGGR
ncbi:coproporphyrinogen III oxidase [Deinococcus aquiradiocola]|uniref:Coproporphyrinogen III oxidase n=1 Tax=Deinococcus aquiradiocola TaxID=393059 RepID=A0A917UU45_9DEIO|nr:coproporphyrinogen III oxidase [Deinococcus aquiradiocola]